MLLSQLFIPLTFTNKNSNDPTGNPILPPFVVCRNSRWRLPFFNIRTPKVNGFASRFYRLFPSTITGDAKIFGQEKLDYHIELRRDEHNCCVWSSRYAVPYTFLIAWCSQVTISSGMSYPNILSWERPVNLGELRKVKWVKWVLCLDMEELLGPYLLD